MRSPGLRAILPLFFIRIQAQLAVCVRLLIFQGRCSNARTSKELDHALRRRWFEVGPGTTASVSQSHETKQKGPLTSSGSSPHPTAF